MSDKTEKQESERVRLKVDLTRYHPSCVRGAVGWTAPGDKSDWSAHEPFVKVVVEGGHRLDVLRRDLEPAPERVENTPSKAPC